MRILVVEDDRKVASFIRKGLEEEGHTVDVAPDGEAALTRALDAPPDLLVLDVMLPKRDGFSVLKALRADGVLSRSMLAQHVWGLDFDPESNVVDVYVGYLRRRIQAEGEPKLLHTVRGAGYVLRVDA